MSNHFHLVLWPREDGDLSRFMQWLLTTHVRRYHRHYHGSGHVWQCGKEGQWERGTFYFLIEYKRINVDLWVRKTGRVRRVRLLESGWGQVRLMIDR